MDKLKKFVCICGTKDIISLGIAWMGPFNIFFAVVLSLSTLIVFAFEPSLYGQALFIILGLLAIYTYHYLHIYHDMLKRKHTLDCSKKCASIGMWYQATGSSFHAYTPRSKK